jgi:hypothetical protein
MHIGSVAVFQAPDSGFDYDRLIELIGDRIAFVPRYRQRIRPIPGRLANPISASLCCRRHTTPSWTAPRRSTSAS